MVQLGTDGHNFTVGTTGALSITLTSVGPLSTMSLGVGLSSWDGTACGTANSQNDNARTGTTALSGRAVAGNYCVLVYDSGNVQPNSSVTYTVEVVHP